LEAIAVAVGPGEEGPQFANTPVRLRLDQLHAMAPRGLLYARMGRREKLTCFTSSLGHLNQPPAKFLDNLPFAKAQAKCFLLMPKIETAMKKSEIRGGSAHG
jgi:hypothetical protein